jgi:hypothetical protein
MADNAGYDTNIMMTNVDEMMDLRALDESLNFWL